MKRKHIEELILACHTDTDLTVLAKATKRELRFILHHEIAHLKMLAADKINAAGTLIAADIPKSKPLTRG
jgi:hypothetical protein